MTPAIMREEFLPGHPAASISFDPIASPAEI
jgi:hypothetical protein